ncbi:MAG: hypothetical protein JXB32_17765 [Deltaproteobacteria bacterium]|nr:hypothetical protein [Deltaproteobacteria bacterium]
MKSARGCGGDELRRAAALGALLLLGAACGGPLPVGDPDGGWDVWWTDDAAPPPDDAAPPPDDGTPPVDVPVGPCSGECDAHRYTACTCGFDDPCGWRGNGLCDSACDTVLPSGHFDDSADCALPPVCDGDCDAHRYTACSCDTADPCGWRANGVCDADACAAVAGADFDDSADCVTADPTFGVTSVYGDGLDPSDADDFATGMTGLGYRELFDDGSTSTSDLRGYLGRTDLTVLYHTGHGDSGIVLTTDGYLTISNVSPGGIRAKNTIFATCLSLRESWGGAFGTGAETVLGYTNYSYDYLDNDVVDAMISPLRSGRSWIYAWYQANAGFDMLSDRWAGYVRESGTIVEYSARSGRRPAADLSDATWVVLPGTERVLATSELLADARTFDPAGASVRVVGSDGPSWWVAPEEFGALGAGVPDEAAAATVAREWLAAHGGLPEDAVPGTVLAIEARRDEADPGATVGRVVRLARTAAGLPVRGNLVAHHIALLVGPGGVVAESRFWPELAVEAAAVETPTLRTVADAVRAAAVPLERVAKGAEVRLTGATPVWGSAGVRDGAGARLVPAYLLHTTGGFGVVVDAASGAPLL